MGGFTPSLQRLNITVTSMPPVEITGTVSVEEQYQLVERKAIAISTSENSHAIVTTSPKVACIIVKGCDAQVDTQSIDADSPEFVDGASWSFTLDGEATTIYTKAPSGSGTLYIMVFK